LLASIRNRIYAENGNLWLCQKSWGENRYCERLLHSPDLKLFVRGLKQSLYPCTPTDCLEGAIDTCTWSHFSDRGLPPKQVTKIMGPCSATTYRKNLKIFVHTL
jgi:hypothetical protein